MMHVVIEILFFPISNPCGGEDVKADRKYEVLVMLAYGFLKVRPQLQSTQRIRSCWRLDVQGKIRVGLWLWLNGC
jgi:hypothetical protein